MSHSLETSLHVGQALRRRRGLGPKHHWSNPPYFSSKLKVLAIVQPRSGPQSAYQLRLVGWRVPPSRGFHRSDGQLRGDE